MVQVYRVHRGVRLAAVVLALVLVVVFVVAQLPRKHLVRTQRLIDDKLNQWRQHFKITLDLENSSEFQTRLGQLVETKLAVDADNDLWELNPHFDKVPLRIELPRYYRQSSPQSQPKPPVQPFDPRFTLGVYLSYIVQTHKDGQMGSIPFNWHDWVDLSVLNQYRLAAVKPTCEELFSASAKPAEAKAMFAISQYCKPDKSALGFRVVGQIGKHHAYHVAGKAFLATEMPIPPKVVFLTNDGNNLEVGTFPGAPLLTNRVVEKLVEGGADAVDAGAAFQRVNALVRARDAQKEHSPTQNGTYSIAISSQSFLEHPQQRIAELEREKPSTGSRDDHELEMDRRFARSLKGSLAFGDAPPKYFSELNLFAFDKHAHLGAHYDWRFFRAFKPAAVSSVESDDITLNELLRVWLKFSSSVGVRTWLAHGSLLSWYWSGIGFPWDSDLDVQMPISDLYRLARGYNQSVVVENVLRPDGTFNGVGRYLVDVTSSLTVREPTNGLNNIDARFIDLDTGMYLDITGLSASNTPTPKRYATAELAGLSDYDRNQQLAVYNCRNRHFLQLDEVQPLVLSHMNNAPVYVPRQFARILDAEYSERSLSEENFSDYYYMPNFRMWVETQKILDYLQSRKKYLNRHLGAPARLQRRLVGVIEKFQLNYISVDQHVEILSQNALLIQYMTSHRAAYNHEHELKLLQAGDYGAAEEFLKKTWRQDSRSLRRDKFSLQYYRQHLRWDRALSAAQTWASVYDSTAVGKPPRVDYHLH
ncbi:Protein MNN4 [[Candida] zeylanoides]